MMALLLDEAPLLVAHRRSEVATDGYKSCSFSPDGLCLLTAEAKAIQCLALPTTTFEGEPSLENWHVNNSVEAPEIVYDYAWYPMIDPTSGTSAGFAYSCKEHPVVLVSAHDGASRASYAGHDHRDELDTAYSLCFTSDGTTLLGGYANSIMRFDVSRPGRQVERWLTRSHKHARQGQKGIISSLAVPVSASPSLLAAGCYDGSTWLYDIRTGGSAVVKLKGRGGGGCGTSQAGKRARAEGDGAHAEGAPECEQAASTTPACASQSCSGPSPFSGVTKVVWGAGDRVYVGHRQSGAVLAWDVRNASQPALSFPRDAYTQQRIGFDVDYSGQQLATGGRDGVVRVYDTGTGALLREHAGHGLEGGGYNDCVNGVSIHPCGIVFASSTGQRQGAIVGDEDDEDEGDGASGSGSSSGPRACASSRAGLSVWRTRKANAPTETV